MQSTPAHPSSAARSRTARFFRGIVCAIAITLAAQPLCALQRLLVDSAGNKQLYPRINAISSSGNLSNSPSFGRLYDGVDGNSVTIINASASYWIEFDFDWPQTLGTVTQRLKVVRVSFDNSGYSVKVQVKNGAGGAWSDWGPVVTADSVKPGHQDITGPATTFTHLRLVKLSGGYMNIREIDFWGETTQDATASNFRSPGLLWTLPGLNFQKNKLNTGTHPSGITLGALTSAHPAQNYTPSPSPTIGFYTNPDQSQTDFVADTTRAFRDALLWWFTGNSTYGQNARNIVRAYATTTTSFEGLTLGTTVNVGALIEVADLLRGGSYSGWTSTDDQNFSAWLRDVASPNHLSLCVAWGGTNSYSKENWSTNARRTMLAHAIYLRDRYLFNVIVEATLAYMPYGTRSTGEVWETTRDLAHASMLFSGIIGTAEMAWNQGVDKIYEWSQSADSSTSNGAPGRSKRIANIIEYHAKISHVGGCSITPAPTNFGGYSTWTGCVRYENGSIVPADYGNGPVNGWGWLYASNYYNTHKGISLPYTSPRIDWKTNQSGVSGKIDDYIHSSGWGMLTHLGLGSAGQGGATQHVPVAVVSYTSQQSGNDAFNLYDNDVSDGTGARWAASTSAYPQSVVLDLGSTRSISRFDVYPYLNRDYSYSLAVSNSSGSGFTTVATRSGGGGAEVFTHNVSASGRYVRLTVTGASSGWASICELDIFGQ
jgi:hypothetical protein